MIEQILPYNWFKMKKKRKRYNNIFNIITGLHNNVTT